MKRIFLRSFLLFSMMNLNGISKNNFFKTRFLIGALNGAFTGAVTAGMSVMMGAAVKQALFADIKADVQRVKAREKCFKMSVGAGSLLGSYMGMKFFDIPKRLRVATLCGQAFLIGHEFYKK